MRSIAYSQLEALRALAVFKRIGKSKPVCMVSHCLFEPSTTHLSSFLESMQEIKGFSPYTAPLHRHGLTPRDPAIPHEEPLFTRRHRPKDEEETNTSPRPPRRGQQAPSPTLADCPKTRERPHTKRQRSSHVDELLRSPAYAKLSPPKELLTLLRERHYRGAAFYFLSQEALRADQQTLSLIQHTIFLDMQGLTSGKPHDLAIRLGWTQAGTKRGPSREALHQKYVVQQGRLPSMKDIQRAVAEDDFDPHFRFEPTVYQKSTIESALALTSQLDSISPPKTRQDWTHHYNEQLHHHVLKGAMAKQTREDGQKVIRHSRPNPGLHQLSTLLRKIQGLKRDRGFEPDWVTVNLVVKAWLRGLAAGPPKSPYGVSDIFNAFKKVLTMEVIAKQKVDFDRVVHPLGKMLVKALKNNGEWLKAREVLAWMLEIRQTIAAQDESSQASAQDPTVAKTKNGEHPAKDQDGEGSGPTAHGIVGGRIPFPEAEEMDGTSSPSLTTPERNISMKHFGIAMQETPSSSKSGNLPKLRKVRRLYLLV